MRYRDLTPSVLLEMNVSNVEDLPKIVARIFDRYVQERQGQVNAEVRALFIKRAVKAMINDEEALKDEAGGTIAKAQPVDPRTVGTNAPAWLRQAIQRGEPVFQLGVGENFVQKLPHIIDWLMSDPNPVQAIRTAPEGNLLQALTVNADRYFAEQAAKAQVEGSNVMEETGREVILTFRSKNGGPPQMFQENTLAPNDHGVVLAFWCKLTSAEALDREGKMMQHCVGSYSNLVQSQQVEIFSLRGPDNKPHVTIELKIGSNSPVINQIKGKQNKPPVARYVPFVKEFLNALNVRVTSSGDGDVRSMGLFAHNGRYGTINEVGGTVGASFANGDTLRAVGDMSAATSYNGLEMYYVLKDGTIPMMLRFKAKGVDQDTGKMAGIELQKASFTQTMPDNPKTIADNLRKHLNEQRVEAKTRDLEKIGLFFNGENGMFGPLQEVATKLYSKNDMITYGLDTTVPAKYHYEKPTRQYETIFSVGGYPLFTIVSKKAPNKANWEPESMQLHGGITEQTIKIPVLLVDFLNTIDAPYPSTNDGRAVLRDYGAIRLGNKYVGPSELKEVAFENKNGSIRVNGSKLFVINKQGVMLASMTAPNKVIEYGTVEVIAAGEWPTVLDMLYNLSKENSRYAFDGFSKRRIIELGYTERGGKLVKTSDILGVKFKLPGNPKVTVTIKEYGSVEYEVEKDGATMDVYTDENNRVTSITHSDSDTRSLLPCLPGLLRQIKAHFRKHDMLGFGLVMKGGKVAAMDPAKDADLIGFMNGKMELGGGLKWDAHYRDRYYHKNKIAPDGTIMGPGYETVAKIETEREAGPNDHGYDDPKFHLRRRMPEGISRDDAYKAIMKFMRFYHEKVMPYETEEFVHA